MADPDPLLEELARMHRGRGLRTPDLRRHLGPALREVLGLDDDQLTPNAVLDELREAITLLPQDLQVVFLHGLGARSSEPYLGERLAAAGAALSRDARTVRRRLSDANALVAQALRAPVLTSPTARPVRYLSHEATTDLRHPGVRLTSTKVVLRRRSGPIIVQERFGTPGSTAQEPALEVRGAALQQVTAVSGSVWQATLELPDGDPHTTAAYSVVVSADRASLSPFTVVVPMQVLNSCSVTVHLGDLHPVTAVREVRGELPVTLYEERPSQGSEPTSPTLRMDVDRPQLGLAFGFAWAWSDHLSPGRP